jgi:hypothetical protein
VLFDRIEPFTEAVASPNPSVLFCTSGGMLGTATTPGRPQEKGSLENEQRGLQPSSLLYEEIGSGINSFDIEASSGQELFSATDQECLVYLARGSG